MVTLPGQSFGDALPAADDPGDAAGNAAAAGPPSVDAPVLADAAAQTDDVDGLVDEQLNDTIADLHAMIGQGHRVRGILHVGSAFWGLGYM